MAKEYLEKLSAFIEAATAGDFHGIALECRHFFSGAALYADERICITLTPVGLAMKFSVQTRAQLLENGTAVPLRYFPKAPIKKDYVLFPEGVETNRKTMRGYARESIEYALTQPKPKRK